MTNNVYISHSTNSVPFDPAENNSASSSIEFFSDVISQKFLAVSDGFEDTTNDVTTSLDDIDDTTHCMFGETSTFETVFVRIKSLWPSGLGSSPTYSFTFVSGQTCTLDWTKIPGILTFRASIALLIVAITLVTSFFAIKALVPK